MSLKNSIKGNDSPRVMWCVSYTHEQATFDRKYWNCFVRWIWCHTLLKAKVRVSHIFNDGFSNVHLIILSAKGNNHFNILHNTSPTLTNKNIITHTKPHNLHHNMPWIQIRMVQKPDLQPSACSLATSKASNQPKKLTFHIVTNFFIELSIFLQWPKNSKIIKVLII